MTLEETIKHAEYIVNNRKYAISVCWSVKDCEQIAEWLRELQERRKQPETSCYLGSPCEYQNPDAEIAQLSQEDTTKGTTSDLISRQAAIDAAESAYIRGVFPTPFMREVPPAQPEQRWIPVSERLPEEHESMFARFYGSERWNRSMWLRQSDRVIVTSELADGTRITETATTRDGKWKPDHTILKREIVAWMPLPKPYKGETDETY